MHSRHIGTDFRAEAVIAVITMQRLRCRNEAEHLKTPFCRALLALNASLLLRRERFPQYIIYRKKIHRKNRGACPLAGERGLKGRARERECKWLQEQKNREEESKERGRKSREREREKEE